MRLGALLVLICAFAAACASRPPAPNEVAPPPGSLRVADLDVPDAARDLVVTIYPTPRNVEYAAFLLPLAGAARIDDASPGFETLLAEQGLEDGWREMPREGYLLAVAPGADGRTVVVSAARDDAGRRW